MSFMKYFVAVTKVSDSTTNLITIKNESNPYFFHSGVGPSVGSGVG